jgi:hypothetical protein
LNFLESIGMRGLLTTIGVRVTPGSCDNFLPKREDLHKSFNIVYQVKNKFLSFIFRKKLQKIILIQKAIGMKIVIHLIKKII